MLDENREVVCDECGSRAPSLEAAYGTGRLGWAYPFVNAEITESEDRCPNCQPHRYALGRYRQNLKQKANHT